MGGVLFERDGTRLHCCDLGGSGPPILLLHGVTGYAREWERSAELLSGDYHVFALDQRGHGESELRPHDVTRDAYVEDAAEAIRRLGAGPVALVGQSMGGSTALLTAARHPELVTLLCVIDATPDGPDPPDPASAFAAQMAEWLGSWPVPFADEDASRRFFESQGMDPVVWTARLEQRPDGLRPRFEVDRLVGCMADLTSRGYWDEWSAVRCPTLVVLGERGMYSVRHGEEIVGRLPGAELVVIAGAGHDVHLDAPGGWVEAFVEFRDRRLPR